MPPNLPRSKLVIKELEDRIQLSRVPVPYDGGVPHDISWGKEQLVGAGDGGRYDQQEQIQRTLDEEFQPASGLVYGASFLARYDLKDVEGPEQEAVQQLKALFRDEFTGSRFSLTSTHIINGSHSPVGYVSYAPSSVKVRYIKIDVPIGGFDTWPTSEIYIETRPHYKVYMPNDPDMKVIHNRGYPNMQEYAVDDFFRLSDYFVNARGGTDALKALFGSQNVKKFNAAVQWLTGKWPYLRRFALQPQKDTVCVMALGCTEDKFVVDTMGFSEEYFVKEGVRPARRGARIRRSARF